MSTNILKIKRYWIEKTNININKNGRSQKEFEAVWISILTSRFIRKNITRKKRLSKSSSNYKHEGNSVFVDGLD